MSALCQQQTFRPLVDILMVGGTRVLSSWSTIVKLPRRKFLHLTAGTAALPVASQFAWAQTYFVAVGTHHCGFSARWLHGHDSKADW